jgi:RNA polymerase primary sigma factor
MELFPDSSPEAAAQVADLKSYSKVNDEARRKANVAVKEGGGNDDDDEEEDLDGKNYNHRSGRGKIIDRRHHNDGVSQSVNHDNRVTLNTPVSLSSSSQKRRSSIRATVKETGSDSISTYIKSLGQHELLYKEDEMLLGKQVRLLSKLEETRHELELQLLHPPTFAQWANATHHTVPSLKQQIRRSQRAKAALIEGNLRLVITVARQAVKKSQTAIQGHGSDGSTANTIQFQDACQSGIIGLTRATEKFDPDLGFRFSTYATWWIRKEVSRNVSEQSRSVRIPPSAIKIINDIYIQERVLMAELGRKPRDEELATRVNMSVQKLNFYRTSAKEVKSLDKKIDSRTGKGSMSTGGSGSNSDGATMDIFVKDTEYASPTDLVNEAMLKDEIHRLVGTLSPREQAVIRLRFGLDEGSEPLGLNDIAMKFGVEKEQIRKIEARALLKLRQPSRSQVIKCYVSDHT